MSAIEKGWFREMNEQWLGYSIGLKLEEVFVDEKSKYQHILVFKSTSFGNVLVLDGCIQCTERDECCYQEMISHLPLACHANPKQSHHAFNGRKINGRKINVLVVGGGDGGVVREVLKHPSVEKVTLCEIDERVIEVSKQYLPNMAESLKDPRVYVNVGDGVQYMKENIGNFDVIITDAPDPIGAAKGLYEEDYYRCLKAALKPNGIICSQGQDIWLDIQNAKDLLNSCRKIFPRTGYAYASMPTYAGGQIGFVMASTNPNIQFDKPVHVYTEEDIEKMDLKFYNSNIHRASFVLPQFAKQVLHPKPSQVENGGGDT